ncbi:hypothetical protein L7F22_047245 [Adiantum nelumboides]|nr:hypothetical protein [Adiantum nelumboides]
MSKRGRGDSLGNKLCMSLSLLMGAGINCIDNTRANKFYVISMKSVKSHLNRLLAACVGDMVMATVKKEKPDLKKKVMPTVIVRQRKPWRRKDGVFMYFEDNADVIVNPKVEMKGSAITGPTGISKVRERKNPYEELPNFFLDDTYQSRRRGHAQQQEPPSKEKERSQSPDESMEGDIALRRRRAQRSPTPTKRKRSPHSSPHRESEKEEKDSKKRKERKRSPSFPSLSPSSSSDESGGYSSRESPRRGHRRSHAAWRRSNKLKKFKEGEKSTSFLTYDGTFGATDKVLTFIQQFDAAFGDEGFTESSKLRHVAMHF